MTSELLKCIDKKQLCLYFDPKVNLFSSKSEQELNIARTKIERYLGEIKFGTGFKKLQYQECDEEGPESGFGRDSCGCIIQ